ncbi:MAG: long-chain fatty acid--CoA ligase [Elainellaceae cyanobacterium]
MLGFSQGLASVGVEPGDCVAILLPNCIEFVISFYAITRLNAIVLPLNHLFKAEEIGYYLKDSQAKVIITDAKHAEICQAIAPDLDHLPLIIVTDDDQVDVKRWNDLVVSVGALDREEQPSAFEGAAIYQYSSGSTGRPKRVCRTQSNLHHEVHNFAQTVHLNPNDNILCLVPMYHAHGLGNCLLAATCNGATLVILKQPMQKGVSVEVPFAFRCPEVLKLLEHEAISIFPAVPYIFNALAETPMNIRPNLSQLRLCFSAGNFLGKEIFDKFLQRFEVPVRQLYGCTEAGAIAINLDDNIEDSYQSVGAPLQGVTVAIVDDRGNKQPTGAIGEIVVRSGALTAGYCNLPDLNQQAFKNGAYFTGDLGRLDEHGHLYITGRKKILIDTGGRKVDPIEVEDVLMAHPKAKEAVVVGVKGAHAGELVKAVLVLKESTVCEEEEILSFCKERLAEFKVPKIIEFRDEIPKSPLGKILRKALV